MKKKKKTFAELQALQLSKKEQLKTKGGYLFIVNETRDARSSRLKPFASIIIEDTIDIRFEGGDDSIRRGR